MISTPLEWIAFNLFVLGMLLLDFGVFNRKSHIISVKESLTWTGVWIALALAFNVWIYYEAGTEPALNFLTGYLIEKSLSVDNLFVFLLLFNYFRVPKHQMHGVLFWGILGALVMRAIFIVAGIALINLFDWMIYIFGLFLIYAGYKLVFQGDQEIHPEQNPFLKLLRKFVPVSNDYEDDRFFILKNGKWFATPLLVVLISVETTDLLFALDSIPAILAITKDPFIVYSSNVFAIMGLRSLFFALAGIIDLFHHLHYGLAFILAFIGVKMLISHHVEIPILFTLGVIATVLVISVISSLLFPKKINPRKP